MTTATFSSNDFGDDGFGRFQDRVRHFINKLGLEAVEKLLIGMYVALDAATPVKAKAALIGSFAYFLSPFDFIPDILPGGLTDDMGVFLTALATAVASVKWRHVRQARQLMQRWHLPTSPIPDNVDDDGRYFF